MNLPEKKKIDLSEVSADELEQLLAEKRKQETDNRIQRRAAYEGIRADMLFRVENQVRRVTTDVQSLFDFVVGETDAFKEVMREYGQLKRDTQLSFTLKEKSFKVDIKTNKVKKFDERADVASARLIEFLQGWIKNSDKGSDDPMYQLAMLMIERNRAGDLELKKINKLYDLEDNFNDPEYSDILRLFKESNVVEGTATNFYFSEKTELGVWRKIEVNFNRM